MRGQPDQADRKAQSTPARSATPPPNETLLNLRAEYWSKRLEHTLTHTQTSSRLIYLVDAAVLALVYFLIQAYGATRQIFIFASLPVLLLVALNAMHGFLIQTQHKWYKGIDAKLIELLAVDKVVLPGRGPSTHGIYQAMHWLIAFVLLVAAVFMILYSRGLFPDLPIPDVSGKSVAFR